MTKIVFQPVDVVTKTLTKASGVTIAANMFVALDTGLAISGVAASTALGYTQVGAASADTSVLVINDPRVVYEGTGDANFAVTMKGTEVDLVGTTTQLVDVGSSTTDVFKISEDKNAGTAGSTAKIRFSVNKCL